MQPENPDRLQDLLENISALDRTFAEERGAEMGDFYSPQARLMWPGMEDIFGREAIRSAFMQLVEAYATDSVLEPKPRDPGGIWEQGPRDRPLHRRSQAQMRRPC
jgi:hypothetical protein